MKYNSNAILCLLSLLIIPISPEPIILKLEETEYRVYTTNVCIGGGDTLICDDLHIVLTDNNITIYNNCNYNPTLSITSKFVVNLSSDDALYKDTIILIDSTTNESVLFEGVIKDTDMRLGGRKGLFGLGRDNDKDVLSPLYQMYKIANDKKVFYINTQRKEIVIGTYPPEVEQRKVKFFNFNNEHNNNGNSFQLKMDSIYFKSNKYVYKQYNIPYTFTFCLNVNGITVPQDLAEFIFENYLGYLIENQICKKVYTDHIYVKCKRDYDYINDTSLNDITFIIESKVSMRLSREHLFVQYEDDIYFLILYNPSVKGYTFGYPFFTKYVLIIDEDNKRFGIYSHYNSNNK